MIRITGVEDFSQLARELKQAGEKDLRRELYRALQSTSKPARRAVLDALEPHLPDNYAAALRADLSLRAVAKGGKNPSLQIRAKGRRKKRRVGPLDRGMLRHQLFGHGPWFDQTVKPGFFTDTLRGQQNEVRTQLVAAMRDVANKIAD